MWVWKYLVVAVAVGSVGIVASGSFAQTDATTGDAQQATEGAAQPPEESEATAATEATTEATEESGEHEDPAEFTEAFLNDPAHLAAGGEIWAGTCRGCHGKSAYPGKAPKLRPARYTPEFVYDRVTNGFRKMPAWKDVYTKDERMSVTAYVLSEDFEP